MIEFRCVTTTWPWTGLPYSYGHGPQLASRARRSDAPTESSLLHGQGGGRVPLAPGNTLRLPGLSVTVMVDGQPVWSEVLGHASLETQAPTTERTKFRIGSVSKLITVAAMGRLVEKGRFDLDAPVQRYVPDFPDKGATITARQLAGHLGGIRHYDDDFLNREHFSSVSEALSRFKDDPLRHTPGEKYAYSSYGYVLLSAMLEGATGKPFIELVAEEVLIPLGMQSTVPDDVFAIVDERGGFYQRVGGEILNGAFIDLSDRWAAGGYLSTSRDLASLGAAHLDDRFLSAETRRILFTPQMTTSGEETAVGLGWRIGEDSRGRLYYHHAGSNIGGRAILIVYPDDGVVVAIVANVGRAPFGRPEAITIAELFMPADGGGPAWDPAGSYEFHRTGGKEPVQGELRLTSTDDGLTGSIEPEGGPLHARRLDGRARRPTQRGRGRSKGPAGDPVAPAGRTEPGGQ